MLPSFSFLGSWTPAVSLCWGITKPKHKFAAGLLEIITSVNQEEEAKLEMSRHGYTTLFLTLYMVPWSCLYLPKGKQQHLESLTDCSAAVKSITHIKSHAINQPANKPILSLERAGKCLKRSMCMCSPHLWARIQLSKHPQGKVISKIQHHLVLHRSTSLQAACLPHLDTPQPWGPLLPFPPQRGVGFDLVHVSDGSVLSERCLNKSLCASVYSQRSSSLLHNSWRNSVKTSSKPQIVCEMQLETIFAD